MKKTNLKMKKSLFSLICSIGLLHSVSSSAQCVVGGTDFDTSTDLCCPILESNGKPGKGGWYDEDLDWKKLCTKDMSIGTEAAIHHGLLSNVAGTTGSLDLTGVDKIFLSNNLNPDAAGTHYGKSSIVAQPKLISPFLKANDTPNNMFVNVGCKDRFPMLSYSMAGLEPGSTVTLTFIVYDLFDVTYFRYLNDTVCAGTTAKKKMSDFMTGYNYVASNKAIGGGNGLEFGVTSSADVKAGEVLFDPYNNNMLKRDVLTNEKTAKIAFGGSANMTYTTKVPDTGSLTFYFYRTSDCYKIPVGIDNIHIEGSIKPAITYTGNPCPEQPLRVFTKQSYPDGTTFSWKESVTGLTSTGASFNFIPDAAETDYTVTCEVTLPGCKPAKSEPLTIHSGTCCTTTDGAPMAMTNLFFDDFGNFVSDDTYEWTDRMGTTHTEKIPAGHMHYSQSMGNQYKTPCARAYNIESTGATLKVPYLRDEGANKELYDHGMYVISAHGGYPSGVNRDADGYAKGIPATKSTGGMLQFDLLDDGSQDDFFEIDVEHICTGKEITFGAAFASMSEHPGCIEVTLEHKGKVLESDSKSFTGGPDGWKDVNKKFTIASKDVGGADEVTVTMKVKHNQSCVPLVAGTGDTRDYAIDNIIFQVCSPPDVNVMSSVSTGKNILDLCTEDALTLTSITTGEGQVGVSAVERFYTYSNGQPDPNKKVGYVYQYTFDDPANESEINKIDWKTLHTDEVLDKETFEVKVQEYWDEIFSKLEDDPNHEKHIFFRVVVGEYNDLIADQSWKKSSAFSPCRKISISKIPVVAGLNCAACSHLDFEKTGVTFTADNGKLDTKKKTVELCSGESVKLGIEEAVQGVDKDGNVYGNYDVKWFKEEAKGTALETKKCKTDDDTEAPTLSVSYDDVKSAGATGVKYIISFHDYFDPKLAVTPCDMTDTITVIANPKPEKTLDNPDPFCEGTLASEPEKKISGYAIQWFETETDTTKASEIAEPVIGGLTKPEPPKSYYSYYYVLTDKTTGCRGDANEYVVKVNKAEANNVDNSKMIEYKKTDAIGGSLKPLDQQSGSTFKPALSVKDHTLMIGLVEGATDATAPDLATAKFGAASSTIPTPTVKDVNNSDDEYLWYYTYLESKEGCLSDTVLVGVVIKGAPSPITYSAAYCVNSPEVKPMSEYAEPAIEDKNGTLKFYDTDKTTPMDPSDFPAVSTPGKYTYWVSQESSTGGGESSKQPIVIEVYGVNDVELSRTSDKYCKNDQNAKAVDDIVTSVAASGNNKDYIKSDEWEFFEANEPTLNEKTSGAASTMSVSTSTAGEFKYYARRIYRVDNKLTNSTEVCYGKHVEYTVEIQSVADPITTNVTYLKAEGAPENGGFKKPTEQNPDAVIGDANCTDCSIVWYDEKKVQKDENDVTPKYNASLEGNEEHKYYVKQVNSLGCESDFKEVMIIVSGYPTPTVKNISVCENSSKLTGTIPAKINETDAAKESDFKLVWYKSNADGTMDESQEFDEIELNPSVQAVESGSEKTEYKYYVLQRLVSSTTKPYAQSAPVPVTVTINAKPRLKELVTAPKCKGESQKLSEMYISVPNNCEATYYDSTMAEMSSDVVTEAGLYEVKRWYVINEGTSDKETCSSTYQELTVVFHELDAKIVGSDRTCPGVSVDLDADITVGGGLKESEVRYTWTNEENTETGDKKGYNTGTEGLEATGDKMKVTLVAESDACKGSRAVKQSHQITVGDGPLVGKIAFSENKNTETKEEFVSASSIEFNSCGGKVDVKLTGIENKDGGKYTLSGSSSESGSFSSETDGEATLSLGEGTYTLEYVNECPTKFEFTIHDFSNKASSTNSNMTICEKEKWSAEIVNIEGPKPKIEWQKDGMEIPGETNEKLQFNETKPEDSGVYTYTLYSAGCRFDGKIATGNALKVKPYVVFDESSYEKKYEVINGDKQEINLGIKVPASVSDIESDIKWTDMNSGFSHEGTGLLIDPVDTDYNLHIVAENKNYCKAETDIVVLVDARLQMTAELERIQICEGETTKLIVDTTGTGNVLHPGDLVLKVTETTIDGDKTINLTPNRSTGKLEAEVSPVHDAKYVVTYTYKVGDQDASKPLELTVHEKFQVEWLPVAPVCQGDAASVEIVKVYPIGTELDWSDNPADEIVSGSISGATFMPIHTGSGVARQTKTYKVIAKNGICQDKPFMINIDVDKPIEGEIMTADKICQYDELSLDASSYQADTYEWKYEEKDSVFTGVTAKLVPDPDYATFSLSMTRGKCSAEVQKYVEVTSAPSVLQVDSIGIRQIEIQMEVGLGTGEFKYIIDGNEDDPEIGNNIREGLSYSEHVVKVIDEVGCSTEFRFVVNNPAIEIPIHVSPNGDGVSDRFVVKGLAEGYPDAKVTIFDRWGKELASYNAGDGTDWDGVYNGVSMPSTDYWYEIQIKEIKKTYTGHFTLIRQ
jgi:gliding motility-associated-like protein